MRLKRGDAAFVHETAAVIARTANGADAEPFRGNRVDFAVMMARHQHFHPVLDGLRAIGRKEMLAVPERDE